MKVPLLDLKAQYNTLKSEITSALEEVISSQHFILGPKVEECERLIASYSQTRFACGVSSGTDALLLALMCEGIGPGDEVITSDYSFFATAGSISRLGAHPVFVDIDPVTYNLDPAAIESKITSKTKAIIPVHLYGQTADMQPVLDLARKRHLVVIEDAAQAIGAEYRGQRAGSMGHYGCFSFFPSKNLGCFGDGGMVVTNDPERIEKLNLLRNHGAKPKYYHSKIGGNFRLDALQAAVVTVKLNYLDTWSAKRAENARLYGELFISSGLLKRSDISLPAIVQNRHIFNQYVIRAARRNELINFLKEKEIGCEVYYPVPFHLQECFRNLGYQEGDFPESEKAARETLALPIYPELDKIQIAAVVNAIVEFYSQKK
jgi:dTDP-4-amino-4,6-dideoxygalactose transaminase